MLLLPVTVTYKKITSQLHLLRGYEWRVIAS
jgi:hypothetical protein